MGSGMVRYRSLPWQGGTGALPFLKPLRRQPCRVLSTAIGATLSLSVTCAKSTTSDDVLCHQPYAQGSLLLLFPPARQNPFALDKVMGLMCAPA
jgi:hypothetical protein